jgi:hypothetical protein
MPLSNLNELIESRKKYLEDREKTRHDVERQMKTNKKK